MCYTYDNLSRVTARTVKNISDDSVVSTETFNYDAAGNVTSAPDSSFQYDTNNRLISFNGNTVSNDLDGNMLSNVADRFVDAGEWIADTATDVWNATTDFVEDVGESISNGFR